MSNKWKIFWVASLSLVIFFQACGMHSWEELLVSKEDEKKMGREFDSLVQIGHKDVMQSGESIFVPNGSAQQELFDYYQARAKDILNAISQSDWDALLPSGYNKNNYFNFKIINSKMVNAFAVPGGYVYFYTAILKTFQSESELSSVLGHEVGHVVLHHSRDRIVKRVGASVVIDAVLGDGMGALLASLGASIWLTNHDQGDELASDSMGFYYTNKLGVSSEGLSDFFGRGLKTDASGRCKDESSSILDVFSTHPPSCDRVNKNKDKIAKSGQTLASHPRDKNTSPSGKTYRQLVDAAGI